MTHTKTHCYRRQRLVSSPCKKHRRKTCKKLYNCKWAKGRKRTFCRRKNNRRKRYTARRSNSV